MGQNIVAELIMSLSMLIIAIAIHEWAHVAAARFFGDDTGERLGRLTLNPLAHIDPIWTVGLPAIIIIVNAGGVSLPFFAAGKPAPYDPRKLTRKFNGKRVSLRFAEMCIAAAGPLSNLILAFVTAVVIAVFFSESQLEAGSFLLVVFRFYLLNIALMAFNLIPIPPLDGSKMLRYFLKGEALKKYETYAPQISGILLILLIMGGARLFMKPIFYVAVTLLNLMAGGMA